MSAFSVLLYDTVVLICFQELMTHDSLASHSYSRKCQDPSCRVNGPLSQTRVVLRLLSQVRAARETRDTTFKLRGQLCERRCHRAPPPPEGEIRSTPRPACSTSFFLTTYRPSRFLNRRKNEGQHHERSRPAKKDHDIHHQMVE